jgi:hypothetical protein
LAKFTWCNWYREYLETGQFPNQAGEALIIIFKSLVKTHYPAKYFSPDLERFERGGVFEEHYYWFRDGCMGEAAQGVVAETAIAWLRSEEFYRTFRGGTWTDWQVHGYLRKILSHEIRRASRRQQSSAWWWMYRLMQGTAAKYLQCVNTTRNLYVPISWIRTGVPSEKDIEQLGREIDALPRWAGEVPQRLRMDVLWRRILQPMFEHVQSPISIKELVTHALRILEISPTNPLALAEEEEESTDTGRSQQRESPSLSDSIIEVEVADWIECSLSQMEIEHLLVIKLHTCDDLTFREAAHQMGRLLSRRIPPQTAEYRYQQACRFFHRPLDKSSRSIIPGLPTSEIDQQIFCQILCAEVHARLGEAERS